MNGDVKARYILGCMEGKAGNIDRAYKHFILSARAGCKEFLDAVKKGFMTGYVTKKMNMPTLYVLTNLNKIR
jgi:hypothetical protein